MWSSNPMGASIANVAPLALWRRLSGGNFSGSSSGTFSSRRSLQRSGVSSSKGSTTSSRSDFSSPPALIVRKRRQGTAWLGRAGLLRLFWLGKCPDLSQQAQLILDVPRLGNLASLYEVEGNAGEFHLLAGRSDAHIVPLVGGAAPPASHHLVSFSYEFLNGAYYIREALPEIRCLLLSSLGPPGCKEFLCCVEVTGMVPEFFLLPTHHGLVLFRRHPRLLLPGPLSPGGPQHTVHGATRRCPVHLDAIPQSRGSRGGGGRVDRHCFAPHPKVLRLENLSSGA